MCSRMRVSGRPSARWGLGLSAAAGGGRSARGRREKVRAAPSTFFHDRLADNFLDARDAVVDREQTPLPQRAHPALLGLVAKHLRAGVLDDHVAHLVVEQHDLVQTLPAAVAGVVALLAALAVPEPLALHVFQTKLQLHELLFGRRVFLAAVEADPS